MLTLSENWSGYKIPEANDRIGGFGSGFMGGLSGHQGALRAMFLSRRLTNKMSFAATASVLALCVDLTRIPIYLYFRPEEIIEHTEPVVKSLHLHVLIKRPNGWISVIKEFWVLIKYPN